MIWATLGAVAIGTLGGAALGKLGWMLRGQDPKHEVLDDLVGLGLIARRVRRVACCSRRGASWRCSSPAWRCARPNCVLAGAHKDRQGLLVPDDPKADPANDQVPDTPAPLTVSAESLVFKEHLERLSELTLVLLLGGMLTLQDWNWRTWGTALFLFVVARPLSVMLGLAGSDTTHARAADHRLVRRARHRLDLLPDVRDQPRLAGGAAARPDPDHRIVVTLSIVVHGTSVKPLMDRFWKKNKRGF